MICHILMIPVLRFFTIVPGMITPANTGIHSGYGIMKYNKEIKIPEIYIVHNSRCVWCVVCGGVCVCLLE